MVSLMLKALFRCPNPKCRGLKRVGLSQRRILAAKGVILTFGKIFVNCFSEARILKQAAVDRFCKQKTLMINTQPVFFGQTKADLFA